MRQSEGEGEGKQIMGEGEAGIASHFVDSCKLNRGEDNLNWEVQSVQALPDNKNAVTLRCRVWYWETVNVEKGVFTKSDERDLL